MIKMPKASPIEIRILEKENNKRGDLFGRLMSDLFLALGYDHVRLNIHKTGREVDVEAIHRTEKRRAIAECKAAKAGIGGDHVNKFIGALDAERRRGDLQTIGYFVSLSGFSQTAIEQEKEAGGERVILLDGIQVVEALIKGRIIVPREKAMERAGRCATEQPDDLVPETTELLAHEMGWIWAIYFTRNKQRTHFALIHADGEALAPALAESVIEADRSVGGDLHSLNYLSPSGRTISDDSIETAREKYFAYWSRDYGEITIEWLPADDEVGHRRLDLERESEERRGVVFRGPVERVFIQKTRKGDNILEEKDEEKDMPVIRSAWANGSFYVFVFAFVSVVLAIVARTVPLYTLTVVLIASGIFVLIIGALQLRQDDRISEKSLIKLVKMAVAQWPLIGKLVRRSKSEE